LALSPDEKRLYTANGLSGDMSVIDLVANKTAATIILGGKPWGIVAAP
jgi:YVTN family beta-propeller protein